MAEKTQPKRQRCLIVGCNPVLKDTDAALAHRKEKPGHRTAAWPVRSAAGKQKARMRNKTGYYDRYNVGAKSAEARGYYNAGGGRVAKAVPLGYDDHPHSSEALGQW